jgi:hypothetical protein
MDEDLEAGSREDKKPLAPVILTRRVSTNSQSSSAQPLPYPTAEHDSLPNMRLPIIGEFKAPLPQQFTAVEEEDNAPKHKYISYSVLGLSQPTNGLFPQSVLLTYAAYRFIAMNQAENCFRTVYLSPYLLANETIAINGTKNATKDVLEALNYGNEPTFSRIPPGWNIGGGDVQDTQPERSNVDKRCLFIADALYDDFTKALFTIPSLDEVYDSSKQYPSSEQYPSSKYPSSEQYIHPLQRERQNLGFNILFDLCQRSQKSSLRTPYAYIVKVFCKFLFWLRENHGLGSIQVFKLQMDETWTEIGSK